MLAKFFQKNDLKNLFITLLVIFISLLSSIYIFLYCEDPSYRLLFLMPLVYAFSFSIILVRITFNRFRIFYLVFTAICFFRYVSYPVLTVYSGLYTGRSPRQPKSDSIELGILLVIYELLIVMVLG